MQEIGSTDVPLLDPAESPEQFGTAWWRSRAICQTIWEIITSSASEAWNEHQREPSSRMATTMKNRGKVSKNRTGFYIKKHYRTSAIFPFLPKPGKAHPQLTPIAIFPLKRNGICVIEVLLESVTTRDSKVKKKNKIWPKNSVIDSVDGHTGTVCLTLPWVRDSVESSQS